MEAVTPCGPVSIGFLNVGEQVAGLFLSRQNSRACIWASLRNIMRPTTHLLDNRKHQSIWSNLNNRKGPEAPLLHRDYAARGKTQTSTKRSPVWTCVSITHIPTSTLTFPGINKHNLHLRNITPTQRLRYPRRILDDR